VARGRALGELYHRALEEVRRPDDAVDGKAWLAEQERALARQYLTPALGELARGMISGDNVALLLARIALYHRDFATAEQLAHAVAAHTPGSSDARKLAADAAYSAAVEALDHGDSSAARPRLERATKLYAEASDVARSDASVYQAAAEAWLQLAEIDFRRGVRSRDPLDRAIQLIDRGALVADPDDAPSYTTKSYVLLLRYRTPLLVSQKEKRPLLDAVAQAATRAVQLDQEDAHAWTALGTAHLYRGSHDSYHGAPGAPWWNRARDEFTQALAIRPDDPWAHNDLGLAHRWLGVGLAKTGYDPTSEYEQALHSYQRASAIDSQYLHACTNQAELHTLSAEYDDEIGTDPQSAVEKAGLAGERCLTIDKMFYSVLDTLARAELARANYLVEHSSSPADELARARGYLDRSEVVLPEHMNLWYQRVIAARIEATSLQRRHADPTRSIATGRADLVEALRLIPDSALSYVEAARLDLVEAAWLAHADSAAASLLVKARADAEKATLLDPLLPEAQLVAAEACLQLAAAQRSCTVAHEGITHAASARKLNARLTGLQTVLDSLSKLCPP
jgi:serine/threonine-protein kinase